MADRPTITTVSAGAKYSTSQLNSNFQALRDAFDNLLGRDGTSGDNNTVTGDIDLNGNTIRNGVFDDLQTEVDAAAASAVAAASSATAAAASATAAQTAETNAETAETNAETAQAAAEAAQAAAEAAVTSVGLPIGVADTMLVRNSGNTSYETKTASEVRSFLDAPALTGANTFSGITNFTANVGIGTASPTFSNISLGIEVEGSGVNAGIRLERSGTGASNLELVAANDSAVLRTIGSYSLSLGANNQNRLTIDTSGRVTTNGETAATGYTNAGDITLPSAGLVRAKNTAKAYVSFDGTGTITIRRHFNVTSLTDSSTGNYVVNFANSVGTPAAVVSAGQSGGRFRADLIGSGSSSSTSVGIAVTAASDVLTDADIVTMVAFGDNT